MEQKKVNETPEIVVPKGYDLFDLIDTVHLENIKRKATVGE